MPGPPQLMAFQEIAKSLKGTQTGKYVGYAVLGVGGIIAFAVFYPFIRNAIRDLQEQVKEEQEAAKYKKALADLNKQGVVPNYTDAAYLSMANSLFQAMDGKGTDEAAIYQVFYKIVNDADFAKLMLAFGRRVWDEPLFSGEKISWFGLKGSSGGTLTSAIHSDMDNEEVNRVNQILESNGVNYRI